MGFGNAFISTTKTTEEKYFQSARYSIPFFCLFCVCNCVEKTIFEIILMYEMKDRT